MNIRWRWLWFAGYVAMIALVAWSMLAARNRAIKQLSQPQPIAQWQAWREDVQRQQSEPGPVQRRVPKSSEPPALVLMRDHFAVTLVGAVVFSSALYWVIAWFVTGVLSSNK